MSKQQDSFEGRSILVSGASSGIGRAIAIELLQRGARAILLGRREHQLKETVRLSGCEERAEIHVLDLARIDEIVPAVNNLAARLGRIYGLCHCAGIVQTLPLSASTPERVRARARWYRPCGR